MNSKNTLKAAATAAAIFASVSLGAGGELPPIDQNRPSNLETATFALG